MLAAVPSAWCSCPAVPRCDSAEIASAKGGCPPFLALVPVLCAARCFPTRGAAARETCAMGPDILCGLSSRNAGETGGNALPGLADLVRGSSGNVLFLLPSPVSQPSHGPLMSAATSSASPSCIGLPCHSLESFESPSCCQRSDGEKLCCHNTWHVLIAFFSSGNITWLMLLRGAGDHGGRAHGEGAPEGGRRGR